MWNMADERTSFLTASTGAAGDEVQEKAMAVTEELVAKIADRIYAMLVRDMRIERERGRYWIESNRGE
jgi:hypothetical protein